jgi:hypothetical protein
MVNGPADPRDRDDFAGLIHRGRVPVTFVFCKSA